MVIYGGRADYWDNEGHVIHYTVTADGNLEGKARRK